MTMTPEERAVIEAAREWVRASVHQGSMYATSMRMAEYVLKQRVLALAALHKASGGKWEMDDYWKDAASEALTMQVTDEMVDRS